MLPAVAKVLLSLIGQDLPELIRFSRHSDHLQNFECRIQPTDMHVEMHAVESCQDALMCEIMQIYVANSVSLQVLVPSLSETWQISRLLLNVSIVLAIRREQGLRHGVLFLNISRPADLRHICKWVMFKSHTTVASWPRPGGAKHCECCVRRSVRASPQVHPSVRCHTRGFIRWPMRTGSGGAVRGDIDESGKSFI